MSIKSELNNTKHYLMESRKAILGRGGEISLTAGLKDLPEAVWSIPADTSLAFQEDSEIAYEKIVPVGAEEYALVKRLGGMSYKDEETQTLRDTKPTSLESRGAQLFDESAITGASNNKLVPTNAYGVVENGYLKAKYSSYASAVYWLPFSMKLTKGTYTISADMYVGNVCPSLTIVIGLGVERKSAITARTNLYAYDTWERKSVTITLAEDNIYYFVASGIGDSTNYTKLDVRFKDIQIQRGETATEFHPFFAEPIDTLELPEAVQSLDGWGLGISAEYNNHIEWRNGRVFYVQMVDETILNGTMSWGAYDSNPYKYCYWTGIKGKKIGFQTSICSHFNNVNRSWDDAIVDHYSDHDTLPRCYFKTDKPTVEEWKAYLANNEIKLVYALAEPIETDITHLFTNTRSQLKVEGGGVVIANNERKEGVPSTLKYTIKVGS